MSVNPVKSTRCAGSRDGRLRAKESGRGNNGKVCRSCAENNGKARHRLVGSLMVFMEKLFVGLVCLAVKVFKLKPEKRYRWEPMSSDKTSDLESGFQSFPMVLVQIPMYNEKEVYKISIGTACNLDWPSERMIIQILDDSTDPVVKDLVEIESKIWKSRGLNIKYEVRNNRKGYKAGALKEGMMHDYVKNCSYVAMFDDDFQPESDFLKRTVPFLIHNPDFALVQSRWTFGKM